MAHQPRVAYDITVIHDCIVRDTDAYRQLNNKVKKLFLYRERQLLSFARAVLIEPKILILDEATSNIDPVTEGLIQDVLDKIMLGRTCIVIAHRFSTIKKAARIIVLHKGRIAETGSHEELLRKDKLYEQL
jgi:ABC-type multidrug transport system fused ATPase/permease subunit